MSQNKKWYEKDEADVIAYLHEINQKCDKIVEYVKQAGWKHQ